ncbi:MAG: HlyC/CorC family transporter [Calditrichaeota bacterium]|nr:HlyC/CorC family transporter [Calditrichota bacterium]
MHVDLFIYLSAIFVLLLLSAFFSGSETAFFSINSLLRKQLAKKSDKKSARVLKLLQNPRRLLITILIGNTLANVTAASLAAILTTSLCEQANFSKQVGVILNIVVVTFLILVISEITPKIIAVKNPVSFATRVSLIISAINYSLLPIGFLIDKSISWFTQVFHIRESDEESMLQANEFQVLLEIGEEQGELEEEEKEMIHHIFEFGDTSVREIMVPRTDMVCISHDASIDELLDLIKSKGHTRIPLYQETIDKIQGVIHAKDLLPFISNSKKDISFLKLARPAIFVPESKKIDDLLRYFQSEHQHMAIVVDEYGGTSGLVTLEDVIEEIVGEIRDEYDKEQSLYRKIDDKSYLVNAKIDIDSLNELLNIELPESDEYDTLGGFILENTGSVPEEQMTIRYGEYELVMEKVEKNRIVMVKITHKPILLKSEDKK